MKLSQAIQQLQSLLIEHGDLELKNEAIDQNGNACFLEPVFVKELTEIVTIQQRDTNNE